MRINVKYFMYITLSLLFAIPMTSCDEDDTSNNTVDPNPVVKENILLATNSTVGSYLTDKDGMSLYYFTKDADGASACMDDCLKAWPVFYEKDIQVGEGLKSSDFGVITREDGTVQSTYLGWPLYYFVDDTKSTELKGEGLGNVWFAAKPDYSLMIADFPVAGETKTFLVDDKGNTLYLFTEDEKEVSNCADKCIEVWPIFHAEDLVIPSTMEASDFGTITRADGIEQSTFKGVPLYYFASDEKRGDTKGQNVNEAWFVVETK